MAQGHKQSGGTPIGVIIGVCLAVLFVVIGVGAAIVWRVRRKEGQLLPQVVTDLSNKVN